MAPQTPNPKEIELKLELAPASLPQLAKTPLIRAFKGTPRRASEISVYFDTDKRKLRKKGLLLRVRRRGRRFIQTIKASGNGGGFARDEWEAEIAGNEPDLALAEGTALAPLLTRKLRRRLQPLFETRVQRTLYPLTDKARAIALTVDRGTIDTGAHTAPLCEIELELERGELSDLFEVARALTRALPAQLPSKASPSAATSCSTASRAPP